MWININRARFIADLERLSLIGATGDGGVERIAGSPDDEAAGQWLIEQVNSSGFVAKRDKYQNILGFPIDPDPPMVLLGSHLDTVPQGGRLDGAYGVVAALEVVRRLIELNRPEARRIALVSFYDEEGAYDSPGLVGSSGFIQSGYLAAMHGYLELHIEQGPILETEHCDLGVVQAITGVQTWTITFKGQSAHAGTTPFSMRHDAGAAAGLLASNLADWLQSIGPTVVGNVGQVEFSPGSASVVPGKAVATLELRTVESQLFGRMGDLMKAKVQSIADQFGCTCEIADRSVFSPTLLSDDCIAALREACQQSGLRWMTMMSGAAHDASVMGRQLPAGMLFVPSLGGISHSPLENTADEQLCHGAEVLLNASIGYLARSSESPPAE